MALPVPPPTIPIATDPVNQTGGTDSPIPSNLSPVDNSGQPSDIAKQYDDAISSRSPDRLYQMAKENMGTPIADAAVSSAKTITDGAKGFSALVSPIDNASNPQDAHLAAADAYKSVADNPQWGTALLRYVMGDKQGAVNLVTGGTPTTDIVYDKFGNQVQETRNALGEYLNRVDMATGKQITPQEWQQRGGDVSKIQNTLSYINEKAIQANNINGLNNTVNQTNAWGPTLAGQAPVVQRALDNLQAIKKDDIAAPLFAQALGTLTQSNSNTATSSNNTSTLKNYQSGVNVKQGAVVDQKFTSGLGLPGVWRFDGAGGMVNESGQSKSFSELLQNQDTANTGKENSKNIAASRDSLIESMRAAKLDASKQSMMLDTFDNMAAISQQNSTLASSVGKPSYIFLPSANSSTDRYSNAQVQLLQHQFNKDAMDGFQQYYKDNIKNYPSGKAPAPGELESAYTKTPQYQQLQQQYAEMAKSKLAENQASAPVKTANTNAPVAPPALVPSSAPKMAASPTAPAVGSPPQKTRKPLASIYGD